MLRIRDLDGHRVSTRLNRWVARLQKAPAREYLGALYKGEAWKAALEVSRVGHAKGFRVDTLVVSAGLGVRRITDLGPGYSATFSTGHADSVARTLSEATSWWDGLNDRMSIQRLEELRGRVVVVMSESYARVTDRDLRNLGSADAQVVLFGGWRDIPGVHRIAADAALRSTLGGTLSSLNQRMAVQWLDLAPKPAEMASAQHWKRWRRWAADSAHPEFYDRMPLTDDEVRSWVRKALDVQPGLSATSALRLLRANGFACEQNRFTGIFKGVEQ